MALKYFLNPEVTSLRLRLLMDFFIRNSFRWMLKLGELPALTLQHHCHHALLLCCDYNLSRRWVSYWWPVLHQSPQTPSTTLKPTTSIISSGPWCTNQPPDVNQWHSLGTNTTRSSHSTHCSLWLGFCKWYFVHSFTLQVTWNKQAFLLPLNFHFFPLEWPSLGQLNTRKCFQAAFLQSYKLKQYFS